MNAKEQARHLLVNWLVLGLSVTGADVSCIHADCGVPALPRDALCAEWLDTAAQCC
jgi:hypothetical protein